MAIRLMIFPQVDDTRVGPGLVPFVMPLLLLPPPLALRHALLGHPT